MKITSRQTHNPPARLPVRTAWTGGRYSGGEIEVIDIFGNLTGAESLELQEYFSRYSGKGKHFLIINLKHVNEIDGMGISVLEQLMKIGIHVRLFNVSRHIRAVLSMARKEDVFMIYNETDCDKAVSLFESEIREEKAMHKSGADNRNYPRVNTHIPAEFKYHPGHNGVISCRANIINLSEGGALADRITAVNTTNGETITNPDMSGQDFYDMKFKLNGNAGLIETKGECVREFRKEDKLSAGLRFKGLLKKYKVRIIGYVHKSI